MSAVTASPGRPLTSGQQKALQLAVYYGVTQSIEGSMPSLARRGLMARDRRVEGGISRVYWAPTDAGRQLAAQIRAERNLAAALTEADLTVLRQIIADALEYRREQEDAECSDCERGDCPVTSEDAKRTLAYLRFRDRLGIGGAS